MDRRLFLKGILGVAGAAAVVTVLKPVEADAAMPSGRGILDEIDKMKPETFAPDADVEQVWHYGYGHGRPRHRPRRRPRYRRVCRRFYDGYGWRRRCWRERIRGW